MISFSVSPDGEHCADTAHNEHNVSEQTSMNAWFYNGPVKPLNLNVIGPAAAAAMRSMYQSVEVNKQQQRSGLKGEVISFPR